MKRLLAPLWGTAAVMAVSLALTGAAAHGAPKKKEPAPVPSVQPAPAPAPAPQKKGFFTRTKEALGIKKKEQPAAQVPVAQPAATKTAKKSSVPPKAKAVPTPAPAPAAAVAKKSSSPSPAPLAAAATAKAKSNKTTKPAPAPQPVVQVEPPQKKGWLKGLFSKKPKDVPAEPQLAKAKTAKPAPVKEVKPAATPAEDDLAALEAAAAAAPKEKRGLFGFIRRLREPNNTIDTSQMDSGKIERPTDWEERKVVSENDTAIYSFGPTQANGPDRRLSTGTVVKVKSVRRGWALVEVEGGFAGYMDASALRGAQKGDFRDPAPAPLMASTTGIPDYWAPLSPPPDLPDQPVNTDADSALLLLPPLELEPKPNAKGKTKAKTTSTPTPAPEADPAPASDSAPAADSTSAPDSSPAADPAPVPDSAPAGDSTPTPAPSAPSATP